MIADGEEAQVEVAPQAAPGDRGQGRSHAIRLAEEGADIIAIDICENYDSIPYVMATEQDLADTAKQVEALHRRAIAKKVDARNLNALTQALAEGVAELGRLDIVVANAGIATCRPGQEVTPEVWQDTLPGCERGLTWCGWLVSRLRMCWCDGNHLVAGLVLAGGEWWSPARHSVSSVSSAMLASRLAKRCPSVWTSSLRR